MANKNTPTPAPNKGKFVALKHFAMPGARVMLASVYEKHLKHNNGNSVFTLIGHANTEAEAKKLCL